MRYTVDSRLCAADAEAELDRLVNSTRENDGTPDIKTYGESNSLTSIAIPALAPEGKR